MDPLPDEVFRQRLLILAAENDAAAAAASSDCLVQCAATGTGDKTTRALECKLEDLLGALRREQPGDPLSQLQLDTVLATAAETVNTRAEANTSVEAEPVEDMSGAELEAEVQTIAAPASDDLTRAMAATLQALRSTPKELLSLLPDSGGKPACTGYSAPQVEVMDASASDDLACSMAAALQALSLAPKDLLSLEPDSGSKADSAGSSMPKVEIVKGPTSDDLACSMAAALQALSLEEAEIEIIKSPASDDLASSMAAALQALSSAPKELLPSVPDSGRKTTSTSVGPSEAELTAVLSAASTALRSEAGPCIEIDLAAASSKSADVANHNNLSSSAPSEEDLNALIAAMRPQLIKAAGA